MSASAPPKCACGLYAVGECIDCEMPCCPNHGEVILDRFRCAKHGKKALAAQRRADQETRRAERQARREAEEAEAALRAQECERREQERRESEEAELHLALALQPWEDELERWQSARRIDRNYGDVGPAHLLVHGQFKAVCRLDEFSRLDDHLLAELREVAAFDHDENECERCSTLRSLEVSVLALRLESRDEADVIPPFSTAERAHWRDNYIEIVFETAD
jgi:hypothetical protein